MDAAPAPYGSPSATAPATAGLSSRFDTDRTSKRSSAWCEASARPLSVTRVGSGTRFCRHASCTAATTSFA
eukprot:9166315-Pyramimonas_sp.AAC.1